MRKPTHQDAMLFFEYKKWQQSIGFPEAIDFIWNDEFPTGFDEFTNKIVGTPEERFSMVVAEVMETLGVLYKHDLIAAGLIFDTDTYIPLWERVEKVVEGMREANDQPELLENFEALVEAEKAYRAL